MKIYLGENGEESVEIVAMLAKVKGQAQRNEEKVIGLDFLNLTDDGKNIYFIVDKKVAFEYGIESENTLLNYCNRFMGRNQEKIKLVEFYIGKNKKVRTRPVEIENTYTEKGRASRRYLLVHYKGKFLFTDVSRLNKITKPYKKGRERNDRGLEWQNYFNLLTLGTPFR